MIERLKLRRNELKEEHARGLARLAAMERDVQSLKDTLMRIAGAIEVLDEEVERQNASPGG